MPVTVGFAAKDPESGISRYGESFYEETSQDAVTVTSPVPETAWVVDNMCGCGGCDGENFYARNNAGLHAAWVALSPRNRRRRPAWREGSGGSS